MFIKSRSEGAWSDVGLRFLTLSILMCILLSVLDGVLRGPLQEQVRDGALLRMMTYWVTDFRYLFEQGVYAATVFFVGAKFFETRTVMTIGFDRADGSKVAVKGPDDENVVWIGRRYDSPREAQAVASAMAERLAANAKPG
jgi:hypothetical protein